MICIEKINLTEMDQEPEYIVSRLNTGPNCELENNTSEDKNESEQPSINRRQNLQQLEVSLATHKDHVTSAKSLITSNSKTDHKEKLSQHEVQNAVITHSLTTNLIRHPFDYKTMIN